MWLKTKKSTEKSLHSHNQHESTQTYACTHVHAHTQTHTHSHTHTLTHMHARTHTNTLSHPHPLTHTHTHTFALHNTQRTVPLVWPTHHFCNYLPCGWQQDTCRLTIPNKEQSLWSDPLITSVTIFHVDGTKIHADLPYQTKNSPFGLTHSSLL